MADVLEAALDYARRDIPVFPVNPLDKSPLTEHGFKDAIVDEQQVRLWWKQWPTAMIGAPTGARSGLWVLDADIDPIKKLDGPAELEKLTAIHGPLPATLTSITPRGGKHYFFRWNGANIRNSNSKIALGLDVRGNGGYVVLPPSVRADGKAYQWLNGAEQAVDALAWLLEQANKPKKEKANGKANNPQPGQGGPSGSNQLWALTALENECSAIRNAPPGQRNDQINRSSFNLHQIVAGGDLDEQVVRNRLFQAAEACGYVADDGAQQAWATIDSGAQAGLKQPRIRPSGPQSGSPPPPPPPPPPPGSPQPAAPQPGPQPQPGPAALPIIRLIGGQLPRIVNEAEAALIADGKQGIYQRGDLVVRPMRPKLRAADDRITYGWQLIAIVKPYMIETFTRVAQFERWNERAKKFVIKDCPDWVADTYLARIGRWKIPVLLKIVNAPFLRSDGTLCDRPGYDPDTALLYIRDRRENFPTVPAAPTREQAREALDYLDGTLFEEFPFVEETDHVVALSLVLTALDRHAIATAPLHGFTSPVAGTGKSLLIDIASLLSCGELMPVIAQSSSREEFEKRLGAALLSGDAVISIDNCSSEVDSDMLCQALTQRELRIRLLGYSRLVKTPVTALFCVNGNNLVIANDLTRRTLLCRLDAGMERPERRTFKRNVMEVARTDRGRLVAAALTVLRGWHAARTVIGIEPMGSFEEWSFRIRQPLIWLDRADPCDSIETVRENDPFRSQLNTVLMQWKEKLGTQNSFTVRQVIERAVIDPDFYGALAAVAISSTGGSLSNDRLGRYLGRNNGKIVGNLKLTRIGNTHGYPTWQVFQV
jgi:Bifunctional DNA primase/polymerase, N-terminal